jgi:hypothetical protein
VARCGPGVESRGGYDEGGYNLVSARPVLHTKQARELSTFERLAPLIGWKVVRGSIQQPKPPEPDILCTVEGVGQVAVELVSLDDEYTNLRLANWRGTRGAWQRALSQWPEAEEAQLRNDMRNAYITVNFAEDLGVKGRAEAFHVMQAVLLGLPGFKGEITAETLHNPKGFQGAKLWRNDFESGPHFQAPSVSNWSGPQVEKIIEKLTEKTYAPVAPMELFAYSPYNEPDGAVGSIDAIQAAVAAHMPKSKFRRVHIFHAGFGKHVWSSP